MLTPNICHPFLFVDEYDGRFTSIYINTVCVLAAYDNPVLDQEDNHVQIINVSAEPRMNSPVRIKPARLNNSMYRDEEPEIDTMTIPTIRTVMYDSNPDDDSDDTSLPPKRTDTEIKMEKLGRYSIL